MRKILELFLSLGFAACSQLTSPPGAGNSPQAKDMNLIGFNDLQARSAYQPVIHHQKNRFIATSAITAGRLSIR